MFAIDETLKTFIQSDVAILVGTRDNDLVPEITNGWAPRVLENGRELDLFLDVIRSERTLANLRANGLIAVTMASPITYHAFQVKGWCTEITDTTPDDEPWLERHRQAFTESLRARREPAAVTRNYWSSKTIRVRLQVDEAFDQTPGPGAGGKL